MGRRITKHLQNIGQLNTAEQTAEDILLNEKEYIANDTFDVISYIKSKQDIDFKALPLKDELSGYIRRNNGLFEIVVNSSQSPYRQRFTAAHELGHYFLHSRCLIGIHQDTVLFRDANEDKLNIEYSANDFAAELLLPRDKFKEAIASGINTPKALSNKFQVTEKAILYRAYKLGIIKSFTY